MIFQISKQFKNHPLALSFHIVANCRHFRSLIPSSYIPLTTHNAQISYKLQIEFIYKLRRFDILTCFYLIFCSLFFGSVVGYQHDIKFPETFLSNLKCSQAKNCRKVLTLSCYLKQLQNKCCSLVYFVIKQRIRKFNEVFCVLLIYETKNYLLLCSLFLETWLDISTI